MARDFYEKGFRLGVGSAFKVLLSATHITRSLQIMWGSEHL